MKSGSCVSKLGVLTTFLVLSSAAFAQESSPYSFSGPCGSQGQWTRAALSHTNEVKQVVNKLKDNPACNALKTTIQGGLEGVDQYLGEIDKSYASSGSPALANFSKLPQEISALRSFSRENSMFRDNVIQLLMGKTVEHSALSSQRVANASLSPQETADSLSTLQQRNHRAAMAGLGLFNSTMGAMQEAQANCLDGTDGATAVAGMVKILSSFASSGDQGMNSQLAMAVQNLGQYLGREKKYVDALRKLNDREFISSMSCLMEVTTDGYCSALDAQYMFKEITDSQTIKVEEFTNKRTGLQEKRIVGVNKNFTQKLEEGPLAGYYILTRQVPVVTEWIQKVQYGITPQLPTEADFQISVSTNVYEHYNTLKKIEGTFNYQKKLMAELTDFKAKQTYALTMLENVAESMMGRSGMRGSDSENFFSKVSTQNEIYFRLLGIPVPEAVLGTGEGGIQFSGQPDKWMRSKYRTLPLFNDPDKLADTMYDNMQVLFREATSIAIAYYNKYFIVDKVQVVNDSLLGLDVNVRDALVNIDRYLENLERRIEQDSKDPTMVASILDTRRRIGRILSRYKDLRQYSLSLLEYQKANQGFKTLDDEEMSQKLRKVGDALLQQVYTEFEILTARTGFLSKRMAGFVFQDYTLSLRKRDEFNQYFDDLMLATGYNSLNTMMNMSQTEFSKIKTDLDQAMNIYKKNIDALEPVVTGVFMRNIFDLKLMASGQEITEVQRTQMIYEMEHKIGAAQIPGEDSSSFQRGVRGYINRAWMDLTFQDTEQLGAPGFWGKLALPFNQFGNWALGKKGKIVSSPVSEFDTAEGEMAKLCVQTLAFANLRPYWELCRDSMLASPLANNRNMTDSQVKEVVENYLSVKYVAKAYENIEPNKVDITTKDRARNYQARICALRDYHRRNEVARITSSMRTDGDTYENEFTKTIKDAVVQVPSLPGQAAAKDGAED